MAVQVLIRRKFIAEHADAVATLMVKLRSAALAQPGYVSGESLKCIDPPGDHEYLARSTWRSLEDWKRWLASTERQAIQHQIDALTQEETKYFVYESMVGGIQPKAGS